MERDRDDRQDHEGREPGSFQVVARSRSRRRQDQERRRHDGGDGLRHEHLGRAVVRCEVGEEPGRVISGDIGEAAARDLSARRGRPARPSRPGGTDDGPVHTATSTPGAIAKKQRGGKRGDRETPALNASMPPRKHLGVTGSGGIAGDGESRARRRLRSGYEGEQVGLRRL